MLEAVAALGRRAASSSWFAAVGARVTDGERAAAAGYLRGLGLDGVALAPVGDWPTAKAVANAPDWDPAWWDAEERLRIALLAGAGARHGRPALLASLSQVAQSMSDGAYAQAALASARAGIADPALARAASGAATQACYLAALARAADADPDHPFLAKFSLFEGGRWPLGIVAHRFHLF